jgi:hypothetical protein
MSDWKERFTTLGFRPTEFGGMKVRFEDIDIVAVEHPFNGLCIMGNQFDGRQACDFETFIPVDSDFQAIAAALVRIHDLVHPKEAPVPPPEPARKRPSNEEALAQIPGLIRQFHSAMEELTFLFQRQLSPHGYLDQKIGEIIAAYIYDLELTANHEDFSEAKTTDGRRVQVHSTRAQASRETVPLKDIGEHLLVLQLWGQEVIEVYNGPLDPIWAAARQVRKDGTRRISMRRLRGRNKYGLTAEQKIEPKRAWKFDPESE